MARKMKRRDKDDERARRAKGNTLMTKKRTYRREKSNKDEEVEEVLIKTEKKR